MTALKNVFQKNFLAHRKKIRENTQRNFIVPTMTLSLIIAGGIFLTSPKAATTETLFDHTLRGEPIPASDVVTWNRFGTPMLPDGKGGYSLIAPINQDYINLSLKQPPRPSDPSFRAYRPAATVFANPVSATLPVAEDSTAVYSDAAPAAPLTSATPATSDDVDSSSDQQAAPAATTEGAAPAATEEAAPAATTTEETAPAAAAEATPAASAEASESSEATE